MEKGFKTGEQKKHVCDVEPTHDEAKEDDEDVI
jgi:hypothetical protein